MEAVGNGTFPLLEPLSQTFLHPGIQGNRQAVQETGRQTRRQADRHWQTDGQTDRQVCRRKHTDRQAGRQTDTDRQTGTPISVSKTLKVVERGAQREPLWQQDTLARL